MEKKPIQKKLEKKSPNSVIKYSGIGFQMIAVMLIGVFGGIQLDKLFSFSTFPIFTVVLTILSVFIAIYLIIREFLA